MTGETPSEFSRLSNIAGIDTKAEGSTSIVKEGETPSEFSRLSNIAAD